MLYENQEHLETPDLLNYAKSLKLSDAELKIAIEKETFADIIKNDFMGGVRSGVNGTPSFFINGNRYDGSFDYENLVTAIESIESNT
jgi:protein-disulfide isomerase